jgi:hypothetical protein
MTARCAGQGAPSCRTAYQSKQESPQWENAAWSTHVWKLGRSGASGMHLYKSGGIAARMHAESAWKGDA